MGSNENAFYGWMATDATLPMKYQAFKPKTWEETDVDIKISHCGVCASDLHTMRSGWVRIVSHRTFSWFYEYPSERIN